MKPKVYNLAAMALLALVALGAPAYAQQTVTIAPAKPLAPANKAKNAKAPKAITILPDTQLYIYGAPPALATVPGTVYAYTEPLAVYPSASAYDVHELATVLGSQDTVYQKKMKALQKQMSDLQKQMGELRTEENKRNRDEMNKRFAERSKEFAQRYTQTFERDFSSKFKNFDQKFNWDRTGGSLDEKVKSGDVKLKTKAFAKSYSVDADDKLQIDNRYGKVTVNTWNKKEFKVDVEIKAYADDDSKASELLDAVSINDSKDGSAINFTTKIGETSGRNNFWGTWSSNGKTSVRQVVINYIVYMPAKNPVTIKNTYGSVFLPELFGKVDVKAMYGGVRAKSLTNPANTISVKYGNVDIENLVGADLDIAYGSLNLDAADKLKADLAYGSAKIGKVSTSGVINARYGGLQIDNLARNLKTLQVTSSYTPIKLASVANTNADFDVTVRYGAFTYDNNSVSVTTQSPDDSQHYSTTKTYKGRVGKGDSDKTITITTNYAGVKFEQ